MRGSDEKRSFADIIHFVIHFHRDFFSELMTFADKDSWGGGVKTNAAIRLTRGRGVVKNDHKNNFDFFVSSQSNHNYKSSHPLSPESSNLCKIYTVSTSRLVYNMIQFY